MTGKYTLRRKSRSGVILILRFAMSWLSFAARKCFSAAVIIARRCDGRAWNVRHTKFPNLIRAFRPMRNPATYHFFCTQIEIDYARRATPPCAVVGGLPEVRRRAVAPSLNLLYGRSAAARRR